MSTKPARPSITPGAGAPAHELGASIARGAVGVTVVLVAVAAGRLLWLSRHWPVVHDAPIMHYVAWRLLDGAVPYRDVFDMNFPGVYLAHVLLLATLGPGDLAFRAFDLTLVAAIGAGLAAACRVGSPWGGAAAVALFALYHVAGGPWLTGQRDLLLSVLLVWGAAGVLGALDVEGRARSRRLGGAALALGTAVWVKPHASLLALALLGWAAGPRAARRARVAPIVLGLALPGVAAVAWLAGVGGLSASADITLGYLIPLYSRLARNDVVHELASRDYGLGVLAGLAAWAALGAIALARDRRRTLSVLAIGLAYGVAHFWLQGRGWEYHFYPLVLFAVALGGAGLGVAVAAGRRTLTVGLLLVLAVTSHTLWTKGQRNLAPRWIAAKLVRVDRLVGALRPIVATGGTVQVLDTSEGGLHALLRLRAREPSRFLYDFHFHHDVSHPYVQRLRAELLDALRARPPAAVVIFERGWPTGGYDRLDEFAELQRWLGQGYRLTEEGDGYRLYVARTGLP